MEILFETNHARLLQCDLRSLYILEIFGENISFRVCELISFSRKLHEIDIDRLLSSDSADVEIIHLPHCDRVFVFNTLDILELIELMRGAFAMLELNSIIHKEIVRKGTLV